MSFIRAHVHGFVLNDCSNPDILKRFNHLLNSTKKQQFVVSSGTKGKTQRRLANKDE